MDKYVKKYTSDEEKKFLKVDRDPWEASASGHGYSARYDDDSGHLRGAQHDDSDSHGLRNKLPDEAGDGIHGRLSVLLDGQEDQPAGKLLGGGGPVSDNEIGVRDGSAWKGSGRKGPKYPAKRGPIGNMKGWK